MSSTFWRHAGALGQRTTLLLALAAVGGCATTRPASSVVPRDLVEARAAASRASASPNANMACDELREAELALEAAEAAQRDDPEAGATRDLAYLALRKAERARIAGIYAAELQALENARAAVTRLQVNLGRREAAVEENQRQLESMLEAKERAIGRLERSLADASGPTGALRRDGTGYVVVIPSEAFFEWRQTRLRPRAGAQLDAIAGALTAAEGQRVVIAVSADSAGERFDRGLDAPGLAKRQAERIRDQLRARGVEAVVEARGEKGAAASVEILVSGGPQAPATASR
jgi:outer membrane protein OmpA-like peptidoglycan-associated protein